MRALTALCVLCLLLPPAAWSLYDPDLSGYVTRVASPTDFYVRDVHVLCGPGTRVNDASSSGCTAKAPVVGQTADVWGRWNKKLGAIEARRIEFQAIHRDDVAGYAVIDATPGPSEVVAGAVEIRADGYRMLLTPQTTVAFTAPLRGLGDVMSNLWVEYEAEARPDGWFVLKSAKFRQNLVTSREDAMKAKAEYDPAAVPGDARPNEAAKLAGLGVNPRRIPPWHNRGEQERIETIGEKLVPGWERNLAASDPSRIDFRFQLTDGKRYPYVLSLPSGIILVPHEAVERMENDSQLAGILADAIACVLEKQTYLMRMASTAITAGNVASWAELAPVIGGPASVAALGAWGGQKAMIRKEEHQSGRVGLDLMHDAGYDVDEAPMAWWLLASKKAKPVTEIAIPERTEYLYRVLAEVWGGTA